MRVAPGQERTGEEREMEREKEKHTERGREREGGQASFPLAACIIQKLAGLHVGVLLHVETN